MKHLAVYMLLQLGGNKNPTKDDIEKALGSVGIGVDEDKLERLMKSLQGKDLDELLLAGKEMLAELGGGGGAAGSNNAEAAPAAGIGTNNKAHDDKKKDDDSVVSGVEDIVDIFNVGEGDEGDY